MGGEAQGSQLNEITTAKTDASSRYIASFGKLRILEGEGLSLDAAEEAAWREESEAYESLCDYFNEAVIHKGIKFGAPKEPSWLVFYLADFRITVNVRGKTEALLMGNFMERRKKDIDALLDDFKGKEQSWFDASEAHQKHELQKYPADADMLAASLNARLAALRQKLRYIVCLRSVLDHERRLNPGLG